MALQYVGLLLLSSCWRLHSEASPTARLPPPHNASLLWVNDFCLVLKWSAPRLPTGCPPQYQLLEKIGEECFTYTRTDTQYTRCLGLEEEVTYSLRTKPCNSSLWRESQSLEWRLDPPPVKLVKHFRCFFYSLMAMNCTWDPAAATSDLQLYYWSEGEEPLKACSLFLYDGSLKTGCHLHQDFFNGTDALQTVYFVFKDSTNTKNTFAVIPQHNAKPLPPELSLRQTDDYLRLTWKSPWVYLEPNCWDYQYRYRTDKTENWTMISVSQLKEGLVTYDRRYEYTFQVKALLSDRCGKGESDWSPDVHFGRAADPDWSLNAVLIASPVVGILMVIGFLLVFQKFHSVILPKIPSPKNLLENFVSESKKPQVLLTPVEGPCESADVVERSLLA